MRQRTAGDGQRRPRTAGLGQGPTGPDSPWFRGVQHTQRPFTSSRPRPEEREAGSDATRSAAGGGAPASAPIVLAPPLGEGRAQRLRAAPRFAKAARPAGGAGPLLALRSLWRHPLGTRKGRAGDFFFFLILFIYLFMAVLGLRFCARALSSCGKWGPLFIAVRGPLTIVASPVAEHRLQTRRLSNCGSRA